MVSTNFFAAAGVALIFSTLVSPAPLVTSITSRNATPCGAEHAPGIISPVTNSTITYTADEQASYAGASFEIIYCSGSYNKMASLNASALLNLGKGSGEILAQGITPDSGVADAGFYGYKFNVTVGPIQGNYITGAKEVSIFEVTTGYGNPYNFEHSSITLNFATG